MLGKNINTLCKTLKAFEQKEVPCSKILRVITPDHVMMCTIKCFNGPIFGFEDDRVHLNPNDVLKLKIGNAERLTMSRDGDNLMMSNGETEYRFLIAEDTCERPKELKLNPWNKTNAVDVKTLLNAVKQAKGLRDYVTLRTKDQTLTIEVSKGNTSMVKKIKHEGMAMDDELVSMFPTDYLVKVLSCVPLKSKLALLNDNDHPLILEWNDEEYEYQVILAPRVESK